MTMRFLLALWCVVAVAQAYPAKNVTIIVPYPAGGPTAQLARFLAPRFADKLGRSFIVENVTGGGTTIGTGRAARAAPDGHTLLLHNLQISANVALYPKLQYDTERDLAAVGVINPQPPGLVRPQTPAPATPRGPTAYMRANSFSMAHPGSGSSGHLATALFAQAARVTPVQVPYRGGAPMVQDLLGEHVDLLFGTPQQLAPLVAAGQLKAYGVTARDTYPQFPGAASLVATFGPKLEIFYWPALFAAGFLQEQGWQVAVDERVADELAARGAGIGTHGALFGALRRLGVEIDERLGIRVTERICLDAEGHTVHTQRVEQVMSHWARVYGALKARIGREHYHSGRNFVGDTQQGAEVIARFDDGSEARAGLPIGAAGFRPPVHAPPTPAPHPPPPPHSPLPAPPHT